MMKSSLHQAEQNKTRSLRDCLLVIIQNTNCSFEIVALAAEAIAADARFNDWFLNFAKKSLCEEKLLELLEYNEYEEITNEWDAYVSHGYANSASLQRALSTASNRLNASRLNNDIDIIVS